VETGWTMRDHRRELTSMARRFRYDHNALFR
jgi:hypothetical protein